MTPYEKAKNEVDIYLKNRKGIDKSDYEYVKGCCKSALKAYKVLCDAGHSGNSFDVTASMLRRMLRGAPWSSLTGNDAEWVYAYTQNDGTKVFQNVRVSGVFKEVDKDGNVTYNDINRYMKYDHRDKHYWRGGGHIVDKHFPITLPYLPDYEKQYVINSETDSIDGTYYVEALINITTPDGDVLPLNEFHEFDDNGEPVNITKEEYLRRTHERGLTSWYDTHIE